MIEISKEVSAYRGYLTLCNFKSSTVSAYCSTLEYYLEYHLATFGEEIPTQDHVQQYLLGRLDKGLSWSSINVDYSALRKYFRQLRDYTWSLKKLPRPRRDKTLPQILSKEQVAMLISYAPNYKYQVFLTLLYATGMRLNEATHLQIRDIDSDRIWSLKKLPRPRRDKTLPQILSKEQVAMLISYAPNYKYQVYLTLLYATGMRLSEATHLQIRDIDSDRMQIRISNGKGGKARMVSMPESLLLHLRRYYKMYRPEGYIFYGCRKDKPYSPSAARWAIRRAKELSGFEEQCSIHTLRNCYATHHLELGTDLVYLKEQMGHKHLKTTAKYIRLCIDRYRRIVHPVDAIRIHYHPTAMQKERSCVSMGSVTYGLIILPYNTSS